MKTITIHFPQIIIESKTISVEEEEYNYLESGDPINLSSFIWDKLSDEEQQNTSLEMIEDYHEDGECYVEL